MSKLKSGSEFPSFELESVDGSNVELGKPRGHNDWQAVIVYRGKHCPLCKKYLANLEQLQGRLDKLGIDVVAVSGDSREKAEAQVSEGELTITVAYGLSIDQMRQLGLYVSHPRSPEETDRPFPEPGLFVINDEGRAQIIDISNAPFARPDLKSLITGLEFVRDTDYPVRGTWD